MSVSYFLFYYTTTHYSNLQHLTVAVAVGSGLPTAGAFPISTGVTAILLRGSLTAGPSLLTLAVGFGSGGLLSLIESSPGVARWGALLLIGVLEVGGSHGGHAVGRYREMSNQRGCMRFAIGIDSLQAE